MKARFEEFYAEEYTDAEIRAIFNKVYGGKELTHEEILKFKSAMLVAFGEMDWETGWTQQFHYGAIRNNNTLMYKKLGPDTGFDSIGEFTTAKAMSKYLDRLNSEGKLIVRRKAVGRKKALKDLFNCMCAQAEGGMNYSGKCYICHSMMESEANQLKGMVEEAFPGLNGEVEINPIGTVIGSHTGPGTVALFFFASDKRGL